MSKIYNLQKSTHFEFENYLAKELKLTSDQSYHLRDVVRCSGFYVFKEKPKTNSNILFRLTIFIFPIWLLILFISLPFNWIITKQWGYSDKIGEILIGKWANKLQINY